MSSVVQPQDCIDFYQAQMQAHVCKQTFIQEDPKPFHSYACHRESLFVFNPSIATAACTHLSSLGKLFGILLSIIIKELITTHSSVHEGIEFVSGYLGALEVGNLNAGNTD